MTKMSVIQKSYQTSLYLQNSISILETKDFKLKCDYSETQKIDD